MKNILKAFLRRNELTADPNDMTAVVSLMGKIKGRAYRRCHGIVKYEVKV
jgi:hypothetical protein